MFFVIEMPISLVEDLQLANLDAIGKYQTEVKCSAPPEEPAVRLQQHH
jgi:hypothetical protein